MLTGLDAFALHNQVVILYCCRSTPSPVIVSAAQSPIALPNTPKGKVGS